MKKRSSSEKRKQRGPSFPRIGNNQQKMFIFANVFMLLNKHFIKCQSDCIAAALAVLDRSVIHLPQKLFNDDENFLETNFNFFILKNQLGYLVESKTVGTLFSLVLPSNFESVNPNTVMSVCKIYSVLMMLSQRLGAASANSKHLNFSDIIAIGLAFNAELLYLLWKFINTFFDPNVYSQKTEYNSEEYNSYAHLI